jgi:hypothetical protein
LKPNNRIYFSIIVTASILIATLIKLYFRPNYSGSNHFYHLLLGCLPNFFYILGFSFIYPLFKGSILFKEYVTAVFLIMLGSVAYEIEQLWTERIFDYLDIIASIIAGIFSIYLYKRQLSNKIV